MNIKKIECDPKCGFAVQSHNQKEVMNIAKSHAKAMHKMNATSGQLKKMLKTVRT